MLPGFEEHTRDLDEQERKLVRLFIESFKTRIGKENAITNKQIREKLKDRYKLSDSRVRKIISVVCELDPFGDYILKATSDGYFLTKDEKDIMEYANSLKGRYKKIESRYRIVMNKLLKKASWTTETDYKA